VVWQGFEASLKRLQRDRVDLLQLHESEMAGMGSSSAGC
jgi:aryl-alcohol dehydrogenase-like predicted oxidoreductase